MGEMHLSDDVRATALLDQLNALEAEATAHLPSLKRSRRIQSLITVLSLVALLWLWQLWRTTPPVLLFGWAASSLILHHLVHFFTRRSLERKLERKREKLTRQHSEILARVEAQNARALDAAKPRGES